MHICVYLCWYMHMSAGAHGGPLRLGLQEHVSHLTWVLAAEPYMCLTIDPSLQPLFNFNVLFYSKD